MGGNGQGAGSTAFKVTLLFAKAFPPAKMPKNILMTVFDLWAAKHKLYVHGNGDPITNDEVAALGQARQRLRDMINAVACSEDWRREGNTAFHVDTHVIGYDYQMTDIVTAHSNKTIAMPRVVTGFIAAKDKNIQKLNAAIDYKTLTPEQRLRIGGVARATARTTRRMKEDLLELENELEEIFKHQERMKNPPQLPERGT